MAYPYIYICCRACGVTYGKDQTLIDPAAAELLIAAASAATLTSAPAIFLEPEVSELPDLRCTSPTCRQPVRASYRYRFRNAQVGASEAAAVAVHPGTGEVVYCFANPTDPLPERYARAGFEKQQFHSLSSLRAFCNARGLVNDIEYDNPHDGMTEESMRTREEWERGKASKYQRERALAAQAAENERRGKRR